MRKNKMSRKQSKQWRFYKTLFIFLCLISFPFLLQYNHYFLPKSFRFGPPPHVTKFINRYHPLAENEMIYSGVPASVTLAQAILETGYGSSDLAKEGKNFFGIKCHNRFTKCKYLYKNDFYRCYENESASFRDHSDFLKTKPFVQALLAQQNSDYRSWTKTLTAIHYAEDPLYETKLNKIIERYRLQRFDRYVKKPKRACEMVF